MTNRSHHFNLAAGEPTTLWTATRTRCICFKLDCTSETARDCEPMT